MAGKRFGLRSTFSQAVGGEVFQGRDEFEGGLLPTEQEVIEMMAGLLHQDRAGCNSPWWSQLRLCLKL